MWQVSGKPVDPKRFTPFEPLRVFSYYDGPRIFTFQDTDDGLCLACWSDEDEKHSRFLVAPVSDEIISDLEVGILTVREAMTQPRLWVIDLLHGGTIASAWLVAQKDVPEDSQPQPRTMLHRSLEPILSLRAKGETIRPGEIPGSVIRTTVEGAQKAIKCLAEYEMDSPSRAGRPSGALQKLYDLPVQKTLAASFEVQFRSPLNEPNLFNGMPESEIREETDVLRRVGDHLKTGLNWLTKTPAEASALPVPGDPELSRAIIKALKFLTPSPHGPISELEIRGELATRSAEPIRLSRAARSIVNGALSRIPAAVQVHRVLRGRIRELDKERMRFELHVVGNLPSLVYVCKFEPDLWDDVYEMLGVEESVEIQGTETSSSRIVRVIALIRSEFTSQA